MQIIVVQPGLCVTATCTTSYTYLHALKLHYTYGYCYVCTHACATAKLESQRTAGSKTPGKGAAAAGYTELLLCYTTLCYCRTQETPGAPEDTRGNKEGHQRDRRAQRHHEDRRAQRGIGRDTKRTGGNSGGGGSERAVARPHGSNIFRCLVFEVALFCMA
jgi:hypothetical protein